MAMPSAGMVLYNIAWYVPLICDADAQELGPVHHHRIDGLGKIRHNSSAIAMELRLFWANPSECFRIRTHIYFCRIESKAYHIDVYLTQPIVACDSKALFDCTTSIVDYRFQCLIYFIVLRFASSAVYHSFYKRQPILTLFKYIKDVCGIAARRWIRSFN